MPENNEVNNELNNENLDTAPNYIEAIQQLKATTVSREQYQKLQDENKKLVDALTYGQTVEVQAPAKEPTNISQLRKELFESKDLTNLEYVSKAIELRNALIDSGEKDPFLPIGTHTLPTQEDIDKANKVAKVFEECIEYADGNTEIFTQELMRRTQDAMPMNRGRR